MRNKNKNKKHRRNVSLLATATILASVVQPAVVAFADEAPKEQGSTTVEVSKFTTSASYDSAFKTTIASISNNGGQYSSSANKYAIDGNINTHWETGKPNSATFKNEVILTLTEKEDVDRLVYTVRQGSKGFPTKFSIFASATDKGDDFTLVGNSPKVVQITRDTLEFKFNPTSAKRIKFVFDEANQNWASAAEMAVYKEDKLSEEINGIFTDGTYTKLIDKYNSLEAINALEAKIGNHPLRENLMETIKLAKDVLEGKVNVAENTFTVNQNGDTHGKARNQLLMTSFGTDYQSTGIVAKPGEVFNIYVDGEDGKPLPSIMFTQQEGHYGQFKQIYQLKKGKNTFTVPEIYNSGWSQKSAKGGAVYLINKFTPEQQGKAPTVRIDGGEKFPLFNVGDDKEKFIEELKAYKQKLDADPSMVDIFEFNTKRLMFTGTAKAAYQVYVNEGVDVEESVATWNDQLQKAFDFAGFVDDPSNPANDSTNVRTNIRLMQPYGAAYAAGDHIGVQRPIQQIFLRPDKANMNSIIFGTMHEVGHQMDNVKRTWGEVTNNMWSANAAYSNGKNDGVNYAELYANIAPQETVAGFDKLGLRARLGMFWQLQLKKDTYWAELESMYREKNPNIKDAQEKNDTLALYSSEILGVNLTPYYEKWGFVLSQECKDQLAQYPSTDEKLWYMNQKAFKYEGDGFVTEAKPEITSLKVNSDNVVLTFDINKENKPHTMGYEVSRNGEVIGYTEGNSFTDKKADVNENNRYEVRAVDTKLHMSNAVTADSFTPLISSEEEVTVQVDSTFNPMDYVTAVSHDGNPIDVTVVKNSVDTTTKGEYEVVYEVSEGGITAKKSLKVNVAGDVTYITDLKPVSAMVGWGKLEINKAPNGNPITLLRGNLPVTYSKGLGAHANSRVVYDLSDRQYDYFEAYAAVDQSVAGNNNTSASFEVYVDGEKVYDSGIMKITDSTKHVKIDVKDAKELVLVTTDGGNNNWSDQTVWAEAKLVNVGEQLEVDEIKSILDFADKVVNMSYVDPKLSNKEIRYKNLLTVKEEVKQALASKDTTQEDLDAKKNFLVYLLSEIGQTYVDGQSPIQYLEIGELKSVLDFANKVVDISYVDPKLSHKEKRLTNLLTFREEVKEALASGNSTQEELDSNKTLILYMLDEIGQTYVDGQSPIQFITE